MHLKYNLVSKPQYPHQKYGSAIQVVSPVDRYWVECSLELRQGVVPSANVAPVHLPPLQPGQRVCIVRADLPARHPGDIGLARGDILLICFLGKRFD